MQNDCDEDGRKWSWIPFKLGRPARRRMDSPCDDCPCCWTWRWAPTSAREISAAPSVDAEQGSADRDGAPAYDGTLNDWDQVTFVESEPNPCVSVPAYAAHPTELPSWRSRQPGNSCRHEKQPGDAQLRVTRRSARRRAVPSVPCGTCGPTPPAARNARVTSTVAQQERGGGSRGSRVVCSERGAREGNTVPMHVADDGRHAEVGRIGGDATSRFQCQKFPWQRSAMNPQMNRGVAAVRATRRRSVLF